MPVMAYSPFDEGRLLKNAALARVAREAGTSPAVLALAWLVSHAGVIAIPKAARPEHVDAIALAARWKMTPEVAQGLDRAFPPPRRRTRLAMI